MNIGKSILLAFESIKVNKLRASLTLLSISIGVFAIIGAGSLVNSINKSVSSQMEFSVQILSMSLKHLQYKWVIHGGNT